MERCVGCVLEQFTIYLGRSDAKAVQSLKRKIELLTSRETDIEYEVTREERSPRKRRKTEVDTWLKMVKVSLHEGQKLVAKVSSSWLPIFIGDPVGKLQKRVDVLIEQSHSFESLVFHDFGSIGDPCLPTKLFGNKIMETFKRIWQFLVDDNISSIGIYGMGGVGKTTLAKHMKYELDKSKYRVYWVTVSQEFSVTSLRDKIANVLGIELLNKDEEYVKANLLRAAFNKMQKSVLILDDVWEEFSLEEVGIAIAENQCRLIWTTRSLQVCDRMRCQRRFKVTTLDEQESWDLFKHTLGHETTLSTEAELIAQSVAKKCGGLPLGINTVAGSMRGVEDIYEWRIALHQLDKCSIGYKEMEDKVFPILEWSFNRLDRWEKLCFLYCCLYPEDWLIGREKLIDLIICLELLNPLWDDKEIQCDHGHKIFNKLVKVGLLEESKNQIGIDCVSMHDLIRDMALRITSGRYSSKNTQVVPRFLVKSSIKKSSNHLLLEMEELKDDLVAFSLMPRSYDNFGYILEIPPILSPNCRSLSTLIINGANITEIPDSFLQHMCGLKVLNLERCKYLRTLPNCISDLVNLTALLLGVCESLELVPPLGKLKKLRILDLFGTQVGDVPQGLEELTNLEHIYMRKLGAAPEGTFSKLHRLQHLVLPRATVQISDLGALNGLEVYVGELASVGAYNQYVTSGCWPRHYDIVVKEFDSTDDSHIIDFSLDTEYYMKFVRFRNKLQFTGCNFQNGLDVVLPLENLYWLNFDRCSGLSDVSFHHRIDGSKDLYHLTVREIEEFKFVLNFSSPDDQQVTSNVVGVLRNLRVLGLYYLPNFVGLINGRFSGSFIPAGTFSSLAELSITECHGLKKLSSVQMMQQSLQNLKKLCVNKCHQLEEIVANEDDLKGGEGEATSFQTSSSRRSIASTGHILLPRLHNLFLSDLPSLENVCSPTITIGGDVPKFVLIYCPKLKRLPSFSSSKITYEIIGSKEWWDSLEWDNPSEKDSVQPFFRDLEDRR